MPMRRATGRDVTVRRLVGSVVLLVGLVSLSPSHAPAQDPSASDLEAQRASTQKRLKRLEAQIRREKNQLEKTRKAKESTQEKLKSIRRQIALKEELISTYQTRLQQLEQKRETLRDTLTTLQRRLDGLREDYQNRLVHAYKYGRLHDLALLLASRSINQMLVRARYLQRFAADRREQWNTIQAAVGDVQRSRKKLAETRTETRQLLSKARTQRQNLRALERDRRQIIEKLQARRSKLKKELQRKQQQAQKLQRRIQKLVARSERDAGDEESASQPERAAAFANLSASFQENRGELPWPASGAVTVGFGNQVDPVHGTSTYHPGIRIATPPGSDVRAVFDGVVVGIDLVPGYGTYVVLRHGDYLSVYSNLSSLSISEDQKIEAGQLIGQSGTEQEPLGASLFFGVVNRSTSEFVNPVAWLSSR
ncbi:MAG: murein hydrolase activator EnvC [Salinibacter sp.]|uniref:murein hydrolase activator EnvC family protein n=1 Tax=Salinibacter sp. TaxID=2065818 RepID=UPI0035D40EB4